MSDYFTINGILAVLGMVISGGIYIVCLTYMR